MLVRGNGNIGGPFCRRGKRRVEKKGVLSGKGLEDAKNRRTGRQVTLSICLMKKKQGKLPGQMYKW